MNSKHQHCCETLRYQIEEWTCDQHKDKYDCPDALFDYIEKFDEYGIIIHDGGASFSQINFCPYCGTKFPESKRDLWFDTLEEKGIDPWEDEIPTEFKTDKWYKN